MEVGAGCEWDDAKVENSTNTPPMRAATIEATELMRATFTPSLRRLDFSGLASSFIRLDSSLQLVLSLGHRVGARSVRPWGLTDLAPALSLVNEDMDPVIESVSLIFL